jgi:putative oxidoreductase
MEQPSSRAWAPLPLRLVLGFAFIYHGYPKLFTAAGHDQFVGMLQMIGAPAPQAAAWAVGALEVIGGLALLLGAFVTVCSLLLLIEMLVAMFKVHLAAGFNFIHITGMGAEGPIFGLPGYEVNLLYIGGLLALILGGAGALSVDAARARAAQAPPAA